MDSAGPRSAGPHPLYPFRRPRRLPEPIPLVILGATGSIGGHALDLVRRFPARLRVVALTARSRTGELAALAAEAHALHPDAPAPLVAIHDASAHAAAGGRPDLAGRLLPPGDEGLVAAVAAAPDNACVINGLVGAVGLRPTLAAAERGLRIALANKESLVVGGDLVRRAVLAGGAELLPVDSEHSAIAQCLTGRRREELRRVILTASGGPFRTWPRERLARASLAEVLQHPTWNMGPKITVDSATLMNKGLEVIEARHLFGLADDEVEVVVHPGSWVHSLVEMVDGGLLAQLGTPDMRLPLLYAVAGEERWPLAVPRLDLLAVGELRFEAPDPDRFPCLALAREAGRAGGRAPIVLNAANEVAVAALLAERIGYADIPRVIEATLTEMHHGAVGSLEEALAVDGEARIRAGRHAVLDPTPPATDRSRAEREPR
ncbi:MAG: 1-deoxy-D-xylulose-5-phosphate reductoisomerase [Candidatus Krumholzibacteriia bacterium]